MPCREALGSPRPLRTKVFLASSQLSVTRLSAEPARGCKQLGLALLSQREGKIQTKCSDVPPPPCSHAAPCASPGAKTRPRGTGQLQHTGMGPGAGLLVAPQWGG